MGKIVDRFLNNISIKIGIKAKFIILFIFIIMVATAAVAVTSGRQARDQQRAVIKERLQSNANLAAGIFETVRIYTEWMLDAMATMPHVREVLALNGYGACGACTACVACDLHEKLEQILAEFFTSMNQVENGVPAYANMFVFDAGLHLVTAAYQAGDIINLYSEVFYKNILMAQEGSPFISPVVKNLGSGRLQLLFTQPVIVNDSFLGIVAILGNTEVLDFFLRKPTYYYNSFINIADSEGTVFFSNRPVYMGRHLNDLGIYQAFGYIPFNTMFNHTSAITGIDKIAYITFDQGLGWTVLSFFDADSVESVGWVIFVALLPILSGIMLAAVLMVFIVYWSLTPLKHLAASAKEVGKGNFNVTFNSDPRKNDEIAQVSQSFLEIVKALNILQDNFRKAENAMAHRDILFRLDDNRLGGAYNEMLSMTNDIIDEFQNFFELISEPIIIIGKDLKVRYANNTISGGLTDYVGLHINEFINGDLSSHFGNALSDGVSHTETDIQVQLTPNQIFDLELTCIPFKVNAAVDGAILILTNITHIKQMQRSQFEAESASKAKSDFLSKMSHEIRTPMNAIMGMAELVLREDIPDIAREQVMTIKQSGDHLLSIINDILDLSKVENGKLEIVNADYFFHSVIQDVISIVKMRMTKPEVCFAVYMQHDIPNGLFGDEVRIRQILLNLLTNANKYTRSGYFSMDITSEWRNEDTIMLAIKIKDSGIGIKQENMEKLFGEFNQFDLEKNRNVEGTGLGLAITKNLVNLMGGWIEVSSKYEEGSEFIVHLPQKFNKRDSMPACDISRQRFEKKSVLLYGHTAIYIEYAARALNDLGVDYHIIQDDSALYNKLLEGKWGYVFAEEDMLSTVMHIVYTRMLNTKIVLMTSSYVAKGGQDFLILTMPAYFIPIVNILGGGDSNSSARRQQEEHFTAPDAKILLVDDINTNLKVIDGLLKQYGMEKTLCLSGMEAIEAVKAKDYDMVLMDHMMPEMDGIETVKRIRNLSGEKYINLPIVALTANATVGVKEMFLQNGFNDFLSKPIDAAKLNSLLVKWIPKEKQKYAASAAIVETTEEEPHTEIKIEDVDTAKGISLSGGSVPVYLDILKAFHNDGTEKMNELAACMENNNIPLYTIHVHALKSACANIGAAKLSEEAKIMEAAGRNQDHDVIIKNHNNFLINLKKLLANIDEIISAGTEKPDAKALDIGVMKDLLAKLKTALENFDVAAIDEASLELQNFTQISGAGEILSDILQNAFIGKYKHAANQIDESWASFV